MYNFKKFENTHQRLEDRITITKTNSIGFPGKFYKDNNIKDFKYVVLYYDSDSKAVGIQFIADEGEKNKFTIMHSKLGYGGGIIARSFFKSNNIDPKLYYGRYVWEKYDNNGINLFVIKLKEREVEQ